MKSYKKKDFEFFYDTRQRQWVLYPINKIGERVDWDENENPIEAQYFNNREELNKFLKTN
jgi:hypothetical protein